MPIAFLTCIYGTDRLDKYERLRNHLASHGVEHFYAVELVYGEDDFQLQGEQILNIRSPDFIWQPEHALNKLVESLPSEIEYVAWVHQNVHLAVESLLPKLEAKLAQVNVVQLFSEYQSDVGSGPCFILDPKSGHPGLAWAAKRSQLEKYKLYDKAIVGNGEYLFAAAVTGFARHRITRRLNESFLIHFYDWAKEVYAECGRRVGYLDGIAHNPEAEQIKTISEVWQYIPTIHPTHDFVYHKNAICWKTKEAASPLVEEEVKRYLSSKLSSKKGVLLTGGLGDFLAIESHLKSEEKAKINKIYYANRDHLQIRELIEKDSAFSHVEEHIPLWTRFPDVWTIRSKEDAISHLKNPKIISDLVFAEDWSHPKFFQQIMEGKREYIGPTHIHKDHLADIRHFELPEHYFVVCPYGKDTRDENRDFDSVDWEHVIDRLSKANKYGVVLSSDRKFVPNDPKLINLSGMTSICEAIQILQEASGYLGVASALSVPAAQIFGSDRLWVKGHADRLLTKVFYSASQKLPWLQPRLTEVPSIKSITLDVPQGIGDIFWIYQKFAPHFDEINFNILAIMHSTIQRRSEKFIPLLPKVNRVEFKVVDSGLYNAIIKESHYMKSILAFNDRRSSHAYACNEPLEEGCRLEDIDEYQVQWNIPFPEEPINVPYDQYVTVYVSGSTEVLTNDSKYLTWTPEQWAANVKKLIPEDMPVVLIGASFDAAVSKKVADHLDELGVDNHVIIDARPQQVCYLLKHTELFIGYQSGLNILADNFGVRQLMIYFPCLEKMQYTWCQPSHVREGKFVSALFNENIDTIAARLQTTRSRSILLTAGLGDFIAIESLLKAPEKSKVHKIYWATRAEKLIRELVDVVFPNVQNHISLHSDFDKQFCFEFKDELVASKIATQEDVDQMEDFGVKVIAHELRTGQRSFQGSSLLHAKLADLHKFNLPDKFYFIHPYSQNVRKHFRDFSHGDWNEIIRWLEDQEITGVIVNTGEDQPPKHNLLVDLTNQTTIREAFEILKRATGFIGASSCFSVLASQLFPQERLFIKGHPELKNKWHDLYYPYQTGNSYIYNTFVLELRKMDKVIADYNRLDFGDLWLCPDDGVAYQKNMDHTIEYGQQYFNNYVEREQSPIAKKLNEFRTEFAHSYANHILDIGIGSGQFIQESIKKHIPMLGYDINPLAVEWLKERGIYSNVYHKFPENVDGVTLWDTLEHIPDPGKLLGLIPAGVFVIVSLPIYDDLTRLKESKHYKPDEHLYYFTKSGLIKYFRARSFSCIEDSQQETIIGRHSIRSFVFRKI